MSVFEVSWRKVCDFTWKITGNKCERKMKHHRLLLSTHPSQHPANRYQQLSFGLIFTPFCRASFESKEVNKSNSIWKQYLFNGTAIPLRRFPILIWKMVKRGASVEKKFDVWWIWISLIHSTKTSHFLCALSWVKVRMRDRESEWERRSRFLCYFFCELYGTSSRTPTM